MRTNDTQDELFDVLLKKAFRESSEKEIAEYEKEAEKYAAVTPTEKQKKQARRAYRRANPRKSTAAGRIAASVILALCLGAASILAVPSVRANLSDSFFQIYDTHISYKKMNPIVLRDITIQFLPEGYFYKPSTKIEMGICMYDFINAKEQRISLICASSKNPPKIGLDNELHTRKEVRIPGAVSAFAMVPEDVEYYTSICWETEKYIFLLDGQLPLEELLRMARSIVENPPAETQTP